MGKIKCETCTEECPQAKAKHEAATGKMYALHELAKCAPYWEALFDEDGKPRINPDRLRELVEADRDWRCVVLPCKLHDKVFFIENGEVKETEVNSFHQWTSGHWKMQTNTDKKGKHWTGYEVEFDGIGKTVFLTWEEAMGALNGETYGKD